MSITLSQELMDEFAVATGLTGSGPSRRYLWTDAFALCNFFGLYQLTKDKLYLQLAEKLIHQVHEILGRHRPESPQQGWISGLSESEGAKHPTQGGLRIGKKQNERTPHQTFDSQLEWERDGQYFHYLTKWMHALNRTFQETGNKQYLDWAIELALVAHDAFTYEVGKGRPKRMVWKMSIDLSRPLVESMGHHDPLDGLITSLELQANDRLNAELITKLNHTISEYEEMCKREHWTTNDPLGIGGVLDAAIRLMQSSATHGPEVQNLLIQLLQESIISLQHFEWSSQLDYPAEHRLAFRELGLSLGIRGLELLPSTVSQDGQISELLEALQKYRTLADRIESYWIEPTHRRANTWIEHKDINSVMLATSLSPADYYGMNRA